MLSSLDTTTRKSARGTSPGSVYSQRCPATSDSWPTDTSSVATPRPMLVCIMSGDRQAGHHGERSPGSPWRRLDRYVGRSHDDEPEAIPREMSSRSASVSARRERRRAMGRIPPRQQHRANAAIWLIKSAPNLMQRLSRFPAAPDVTLLDRRKPKPFPSPHVNTTSQEQTYIRWCWHRPIECTPFYRDFKP
jgi:hypothetical protein